MDGLMKEVSTQNKMKHFSRIKMLAKLVPLPVGVGLTMQAIVVKDVVFNLFSLPLVFFY